MTINEYRLLENHLQLDLLYCDGAYLGKRRYGPMMVTLYQLESFYVEVYYSKYRTVIHSLESFQSVEHLGPYLDQIDVGELVNITG